MPHDGVVGNVRGRTAQNALRDAGQRHVAGVSEGECLHRIERAGELSASAVVPGQFLAWAMVHEVGVSVAARTSATPVPLSATGEPVTATLAKMLSVPDTAPVAVGVNTTLMVQVAPAARVAVQVPPDVEKTADE